MKIKIKLRSFALTSIALVLFLILVSSVVSASISETRITTNPSNSQNPVIYGNNIVWQDDRNGNWDIYIFNVSTKEEIHTSNTSNQTDPAIYGDKVVWQDDRNGGSDIYLQDLSTKKQTRVTTSGKAYNPRIYGKRIVWMDGRNGGSMSENSWPVGNWDIYMYDISTGKETQITTNESKQKNPDIYEDRIVWQDERNIDWTNPYTHIQVYMYNVSTSSETPVNYGEGYYYVQSPPRLYGDRIVWMAESIGTNYNIYVYDLSTSTLTMIGPPYTHGSDFEPAIYGNRVVWTQSVEPGDCDIYMYDIPSSSGTQITTNKSYQSASAIFGDKIVWVDWRNGNADIYMATLSSGNPVSAAFSASPTSGYEPLKVTFTDKSTGSPTSWKWSFDDSTYSTVKNPVHTYSKAGKYTVSLTVKNAAGSNTATKSSFIIVNVLKAPVAAFTASPASGKTPLKVQFTDKSSNVPSSWKWSFGDGTYSTQQNPVHTYSKAGKYTVSLMVKNAKGSNNKTIPGYISANKK